MNNQLKLQMGLSTTNGIAPELGTITFHADTQYLYIDSKKTLTSQDERLVVKSPYANNLEYPNGDIFCLNLAQGTKLGNIYSLALGYDNIAIGDNQTVVGQYSAADADALFIIGGGTDSNNRKNTLSAYKDKIVITALHDGKSSYITENILNDRKYVSEDVLNSKNYITKDINNLTNYYTKTEIDNKKYVSEGTLNSKNYITKDVNNLTNYYTKTEIDNQSFITKEVNNLTNYYTKTEIDDKLKNNNDPVVTQIWYKGETAPTNTLLLWIRTGNEYGRGVLHYYDGTEWVAMSATYS